VSSSTLLTGSCAGMKPKSRGSAREQGVWPRQAGVQPLRARAVVGEGAGLRRGGGCVTPSFKDKTECIAHVGQDLFHTYVDVTIVIYQRNNA
jgi:hypothetical protein